MTDLYHLRHFYAHTAPYYEADVIPAFEPLARSLAGWLLRCVEARLTYTLFDPFDVDEREPLPATPAYRKLDALDIGTGTGVLARLLAEQVRRVYGIDAAPTMLRIGQQIAPRVRFVQADLHTLPFRRGAVQVIVSSFGLNSSRPRPALKALAAALRRGEGMLAFQEWGAEDPCTRIINETLNDYAPDEVPGMDDTLQAFYDQGKPWYDQLQDSEDYYTLLKSIGFESVWVREASFVAVRLPSIEVFWRHKLAWPIRRLSVAAMDDPTRAAFFDALRTRLQPYVQADGSFEWTPPLFRVFALR